MFVKELSLLVVESLTTEESFITGGMFVVEVSLDRVVSFVCVLSLDDVMEFTTLLDELEMSSGVFPESDSVFVMSVENELDSLSPQETKKHREIADRGIKYLIRFIDLLL